MIRSGEYFASINEVSTELALPAHTLRYWEKQFPVAIRPTTGAGGRRYYRPETVARLRVIRALLYDHGMTIAGVKKMLRSGNFPADISEISAVPGAGMAAPQTPVAPVRDNSADIARAIALLENARGLLS